MTSNHFEYVARRAKVGALCRFIDGNALRLRHHPAEQAATIAAMLSDWTPAHWAEAAKRARVRVPSPTTQAAIIAAYRSRVE